MDSRVKERLTGAIILVAAMVILVPEMFSGGPAHRQEASTATNPLSEGPPIRSYTMDLDANAPAPTAPTPAAASPAPSPPPPVVEQTPEPAPSVATPARPAEPAPSGNWWVQVGSFSKADNAQRYAQEISRKGFAARVDSGGKLLRVRVGPVADRDAALELKARLAARGYQGALASP